MDTITAQVRKYVMDNFLMGACAEELRDEDSFMGRHVIDSVGVLELISYLEQTFGIKIEDEDMVPDNLDSLNAVRRYLQRKLGRVSP
jgi:acyl carrier protein